MVLSDLLQALDAAGHAGDHDAVGRHLSALLSRVDASPEEARPDALAELFPVIAGPNPQLAAHVALVAGAIVERGAPAVSLAPVLIGPVERWLVAASRFTTLAEALPEAEDDDDGVPFGDRVLPRAGVDAIHADDPEAVAAFFSLEVWYRPAVAVWTRAPEALTELRQRRSFREALEGVGDRSEGVFWLSLLLHTTTETAFVVLVPELGEAYEWVLDGVVDMGQLTILASRAFAASLRRLGASEPASDALYGLMCGEGPQQIDQSYGSHFYFYPWRAIDPETGFPEDGRYRWTAPGGRGDHSLPGDFQPATVERIDGTPVLVLVGPNLPTLTHRFVRSIAGARMFGPLRARADEPRALGSEGFQRWLDEVRRCLSPEA